MDKNKTKYILIALLVVGLILRIAFVYSTPIKYWDETVYSNLGYDLSKNPLDYSFANHGWSDFVPDGQWPKAGFRPPLLPYLLGVFYLLRIDFLINFLMPLIGVATIFLVFYLGKTLFNEEVGLIAAAFLTFLPLHSFFSSRILTDSLSTFLLLLTFISLWYGYVESSKVHKILFGVFFALSILSRYNMIWLIPVFFIFFVIKYRSLYFLKDKYLWFSIGIFFLMMSPLFIYGSFAYDDPLGSFKHASTAAAFWGGVQDWDFFFHYRYDSFSILFFIFPISLIYLLYKKQYMKNEFLLLFLWAVIFIIFAIQMPHKEDRHILPLSPAICLLSALAISKLRKAKVILAVSISIFLIISSSLFLSNTYDLSKNKSDMCFLESLHYLNAVENNALVITDESPLVYFYAKKQTHFYPNPWDYDYFAKMMDSDYKDTNAKYVLFTDFDMSLEDEKIKVIKRDLDKKLKIVFNCSNNTFIYKYK